jgi:hypothetical protein
MAYSLSMIGTSATRVRADMKRAAQFVIFNRLDSMHHRAPLNQEV